MKDDDEDEDENLTLMALPEDLRPDPLDPRLICRPLHPAERWRERYADLQGALVWVELEKEQQGLGLSLAGNSDRSRLSIFVVGLHPGGPAARDGRIQVGDELLEVRRSSVGDKRFWRGSGAGGLFPRR